MITGRRALRRRGDRDIGSLPSRVTSRHLTMGSGVAPPLATPITSDRRGEKRLRPRKTHMKDPRRCTESGRDLGAFQGHSRRTPGDDSSGPRRRTLPGERAPLIGRRPSSGAAFTLKAASLFPGLLAINRIDGQYVKGSNPIDSNLDSGEYYHQLHTGRRMLRSQRPEPV
jgi:hypothetical protein